MKEGCYKFWQNIQNQINNIFRGSLIPLQKKMPVNLQRKIIFCTSLSTLAIFKIIMILQQQMSSSLPGLWKKIAHHTPQTQDGHISHPFNPQYSLNFENKALQQKQYFLKQQTNSSDKFNDLQISDILNDTFEEGHSFGPRKRQISGCEVLEKMLINLEDSEAGLNSDQIPSNKCTMKSEQVRKIECFLKSLLKLLRMEAQNLKRLITQQHQKTLKQHQQILQEVGQQLKKKENECRQLSKKVVQREKKSYSLSCHIEKLKQEQEIQKRETIKLRIENEQLKKYNQKLEFEKEKISDQNTKLSNKVFTLQEQILNFDTQVSTKLNSIVDSIGFVSSDYIVSPLLSKGVTQERKSHLRVNSKNLNKMKTIQNEEADHFQFDNNLRRNQTLLANVATSFQSSSNLKPKQLHETIYKNEPVDKKQANAAQRNKGLNRSNISSTMRSSSNSYLQFMKVPSNSQQISRKDNLSGRLSSKPETVKQIILVEQIHTEGEALQLQKKGNKRAEVKQISLKINRIKAKIQQEIHNITLVKNIDFQYP